MTTRIAISTGDINGIGPEVVLKSLSQADLSGITPIILSSESVFAYYSHLLQIDRAIHYTDSTSGIKDSTINVLECYEVDPVKPDTGTLTIEGGKLAMEAVQKALDLCLTGQADAMVTAPISKEAVNKAGFNIPGHTEYLAEHTGTDDFMMMLVNKGLRVALATIHVPLAEVAGLITKASVEKKIRILDKSLRKDFNISEPHIAVLGLNPHAGDGGIIGREEIDIINPVLEKLQDEGIKADGPQPADGFFGNRKFKKFDAVLAMYHDQGLIPFKTLSFGKGVNFTAGLPIIRTSPDHGTAFDIAGKNLADSSSFTEAFMLACKLAQNRNLQHT